MHYSRQEHYLFLEEELRAQTDLFNQKLNTSASYLLFEREEIFVAKFVKFHEGELILKFNTNRGVPRKGEYLYCFTSPKQYHDFNKWGKLTYGDLLKNKGCATELVCIWQSTLRDDPNYCLVGFRGAEIEFAEHINGHTGAFLILGPNIPPYQYISNLQKLTRRNNVTINHLLEGDYSSQETDYFTIPQKDSISDFILKQLFFSKSVVLQGPPGTGKTYQIAKLCKSLCDQGLSVLVTALTNRALIEVASKKELLSLLQDGKIHKTKLSVDESKELPLLQNIKQLTPQSGHVMLSTFYITSGEACDLCGNQPFDVVIMDEASQALYGMFIAAKLLGKYTLFVGDPNQLPPVVSLNADRIARRNYQFYINGLLSIIRVESISAYTLTETRRLPARAAEFTSVFYANKLLSNSNKDIKLTFSELEGNIGMILSNQGGPTWLKTDLELGDKKPQPALLLTTMIVSALLTIKEKIHISVLSFYVETTKSIQKTIYQTIGNSNNLLIDTVSRIQGLTTDIAIYVIPNTGYTYSLNRCLFNVATSRAQRHTIIISDKGILVNDTSNLIDKDVLSYFRLLESTQSFYVPIKKEKGVLSIEDTIANAEPFEIKQNALMSATEEITAKNNVDDITPQKVEAPEFIPTEVPKVGVKVVGKIDLSQFEIKKKKNLIKNSVSIIIDTNVFVDEPNIISKIDASSNIIVSAKVIDELDKLKVTLSEEDRIKVQHALKNINAVIDRRNITFEIANTRLLPRDFDYRSPDNMILAVALKYKEDNPILLTSDNGLQLKAKAVKISAMSLKKFLQNNKTNACDVFISYSTQDYLDSNHNIISGNIITKIQESLKQASISYWIDKERLMGGDSFPKRIAQQIRDCKVVIFISTVNSNQSDWTLNEIATAKEYNKKIIPFRFDNSQYSPANMIYLAGVQYISYPNNPNAISQLINAIQNALTD